MDVLDDKFFLKVNYSFKNIELFVLETTEKYLGRSIDGLSETVIVL